MFELKTTTECELTQFTGRTQKSGRDDVPAISIRLKISNASNTMLDLLSPTMRLTAYAPVEGQEQLPGVELTTPVLRCPDMKTWKSDVVHEGWKLFLSRGIGDDSGLQMEKCKLDEFAFDLYQGGHVDCEFRVSTADVDEEGAGMLWGRQKRKVFVQVHAPEMPKPGATEATGAEIDGTKGHPGANSGQGDLLTPEDALAAGTSGDNEAGEGVPREGAAQVEDGAGVEQNAEQNGSDASIHPAGGGRDEAAQTGENWPFPTGQASGAVCDSAQVGKSEQEELEAGMAQSIMDELREPRNRIKKAGAERLKDGSIAKNPQRMGPLTLEARADGLQRILAIQAECNDSARRLGRPTISLINAEEEARIRELISAGTWPDGWDGAGAGQCRQGAAAGARGQEGAAAPVAGAVAGPPGFVGGAR